MKRWCLPPGSGWQQSRYSPICWSLVGNLSALVLYLLLRRWAGLQVGALGWALRRLLRRAEVRRRSLLPCLLRLVVTSHPLLAVRRHLVNQSDWEQWGEHQDVYFMAKLQRWRKNHWTQTEWEELNISAVPSLSWTRAQGNSKINYFKTSIITLIIITTTGTGVFRDEKEDGESVEQAGSKTNSPNPRVVCYDYRRHQVFLRSSGFPVEAGNLSHMHACQKRTIK